MVGRGRGGPGLGEGWEEPQGRVEGPHLRFSRILLASSCPKTVSRISRSRSWEAERLGAGGAAPLGMAKWPRMIPSPKRAAAPSTPTRTFTHCILYSLGQLVWLLVDGVSGLVNHYLMGDPALWPPASRESKGASCREGQELSSPPQFMYPPHFWGIKSTRDTGDRAHLGLPVKQTPGLDWNSEPLRPEWGCAYAYHSYLLFHQCHLTFSTSSPGC